MLLLLVMTSATLCAIPARRAVRTLLTEDGAKVEAVLRGDEYGHWFEDKHGRCLRETGDGKFRVLTDNETQAMKREKALRMNKAQQRRAERLEQKTRFITKRRTARMSTASGNTPPAE